MQRSRLGRPRRLIEWRWWLALALAVLGAPEATVAWRETAPPTARTPAPSADATPGVRFTDVTEAAGLRFRFVSGSAAKDYILEAPGSGCAFLDYDNDGWLDAYLVNGSTLDALRGKGRAPAAALFHNDRHGTFTEVTAQAGVANERWGQGVCAGDFDNDGWTDVYVTNFGANRLYRNGRDGTFTDIAPKAGVGLGGWSAGCAFGDYDGDGRLDLFVAGYVKFDIDHPPPPAAAPLAESSPPGAAGEGPAAAGMGAAYTPGASHCAYRGRRVMCGPRGLEGERDHLFRNNGDGTFTDVSEKAGVADVAGGYGFGVAWFDADDDGRLDLFVANDSSPRYLYRNKGDGTFEDVSYASGTALSDDGREQASMGVAVGDYDGDGREDVHLTNFSDDLNSLFHNDGGTAFTETTRAAGLGAVTSPFLGWGTNFLDYDNDGMLDLLVANGHVYPNIDEAAWGTSYKQRLLLFRNVGGRFHEVGSSAGEALYAPRSARGSSVGDFDNDGDADILLSVMDDSPSLLRNDGGNQAGHWIGLTLRGDPERKCPRDAVGSAVYCTAGGRRMRASVVSGQSFYSQSDLRVRFGLGAARSVQKLEVRWANGRSETVPVQAVDRFLTIEQGKGVVK